MFASPETKLESIARRINHAKIRVDAIQEKIDRLLALGVWNGIRDIELHQAQKERDNVL